MALEQGRYTWRHDSVLSNIVALIRPKLVEGSRLYSDLPGFLAPGGGSIPPHVLATNQRPDVFIVNETSREVILFELTCPWDANIYCSHAFKEDKYAPLIADLSRTYKVFNFSIEISVRGQVSNPNKSRIKAFIYRACEDPKPIFKEMVKACSKAALLSSFSIFSARNEPSWENPCLLNTR